MIKNKLIVWDLKFRDFRKINKYIFIKDNNIPTIQLVPHLTHFNFYQKLIIPVFLVIHKSLFFKVFKAGVFCKNYQFLQLYLVCIFYQGLVGVLHPTENSVEDL